MSLFRRWGVGSWLSFLAASVVVGVPLVACSSSSPTSPSADGGAKPDPTGRESARADRGAVAVKNRKCNTCHGDDLAGSTTKLPQADPNVELYPPNLTNHENGIKNWTDDQLATAIRTGYDIEGLRLCPQMQHDADMTDYEAFSIVLYLRALPPKDTNPPTSICPPLKQRQ